MKQRFQVIVDIHPLFIVTIALLFTITLTGIILSLLI